MPNLGDYTRAEVRHLAARLIEDTFFEGTATAHAVGSLTDTNEAVNYSDSRLIGGFRYIYSASTNADQERRVTGNTQSTGVMTISPNWSDPTGTVLYEYHKGIRVKDYNHAIDQALLNVLSKGGALVTKVADTSLTMTNSGVAADYLYEIPVGFRWIERILYEGSTSGIYDEEVPRLAWSRTLEKKTAPTSSADSVNQIRIDRNYFEPEVGKKLRILGGGWQPLPSSDTDLIGQGLVAYTSNMAAYNVLMSRTRGMGPDAQANREIAQTQLKLAMSLTVSPNNYFAPPDAVPLPA